jgi:hypothetical protein
MPLPLPLPLPGSCSFARVALCIVLLLCAGSTQAQLVPFGKNKIQYHDFKWQVIAGQHIDVYYYPEEEKVARLALAYAEESFDLLERRFRHHPFRRIPLVVYSSDQHFEQSNIMPGFIPEGVLGFTEYLKRRVALPFRGDYDQFRKTLRHELVHAFQISKITEIQALHPRVHRPTPQQVHWFTEGLAEYWSSEQTAEDDMFIRDMVLNGRLPTIREFTYSYSFASYPLGAELVKYLSTRFGEETIARIYEEYWKYDSFEKALESVSGQDLDRLTRDFKYALEQRFFPVYADRPPLDVGAKMVVYRGGANFKPVVHKAPADSVPFLYFLSPRTGYTNLYRTRLTGRERDGERDLEVVLKGERSPEFESFHAYESAIAISPKGVLAFGSKYMERDALFLFDTDDRKIVGRYQWPDLIGVKSPSWDPTGERIVFEGLSTAGFSDLYVFDFRTQSRRALTEDHYKDEDPDWSPDGASIVFSSDRTSTGSDGSTNLFLLDAGAGTVRYLTHGAWHDQDPRWSRDGRRIAFSSDRGGIYDLYTIDTNGNGRRLTALAGGAFDPEWLPDDRSVVFAGFGKSGFRIYQYALADDSAKQPAFALGDPPNGAEAESRTLASASMVPPIGWEWTDLEAASVAGVKGQAYTTWQGLSVDFAGGDAVVAPGVGSAQGIQLLATDMLGDHILFAGVNAVQGSSFNDVVDNFSGQLLYLNLSRRLNFGGGIYRFKGRYRDASLNVYDETSYGGFFMASYPFSKFHRIELQLGLERSDRNDVDDIYELGLSNTSTREDLRDLTRKGFLTSNYISYVKDNTLWLPTGPIDGERYNFTAGLVTCFACTSPSQVTGRALHQGASAENYVLTADYRRYFRTSLLTAYAVRAYGFFSDGAIPGRAVLGGPSRLRGYPRFSLAGSRVWLVNQEWRFPILHGVALAFPFGQIRLPGVQGALFGDIGSSWVEDQEPISPWGSYGLGLRMSLGSPLVLRLDVGRRFKTGGAPPVIFSGGEKFDHTFVDFFFGFNY